MKRAFGALLLASALCACGEGARPNVLLISIDTLRADRLGVYGYGRDTSPALDRFARERAVVFEQAVAESPWTLPSHVTMLTGLHPWTHGVRTPDRAPSDHVELLAERLQAEGYYTFGLTDGGWMSETWGFARGFTSFEAVDTDFAAKIDDALAYVRHREGKGPWFGFLHTYDVHCPYDPPEPHFSAFRAEGSEPIEVAGRCGNPDFNSVELTDGQRAFLSDRYDGGIRWVDEALGKLFRHFDEHDLWRNTVVIVTSDHGEELGEYGPIGHERTLSPEVLRIPLLVSMPGRKPGRSSAVAGLRDVTPTVLELVGAKQRDGIELDGRSLAAALRGRPLPAHALTYSDLSWQAEQTALLNATTYAVADRREGSLRILRNEGARDLERVRTVHEAALARERPTLTVGNAPKGSEH